MSTEEESAADLRVLVEQLRWRKESYTFTSVELWEQRRGEEWWTPTSRNHQVTADGMSREVRLADADAVPIRDADVELLRQLVEGRTIVTFEREPNSGQDWSHYENSVTLTLADGSQLAFSGWGYDASGCDTDYTPPPAARKSPVAPSVPVLGGDA